MSTFLSSCAVLLDVFLSSDHLYHFGWFCETISVKYPKSPETLGFQRFSKTDQCNHSHSNTLAVMPRLSLQGLAIWRPSVTSSRAIPRCSQSFHQHILPIIPTYLHTQARPRIDTSRRNSNLQLHVFTGAIRTIFIQTENTPNTDVSNRPCTTSISC